MQVISLFSNLKHLTLDLSQNQIDETIYDSLFDKYQVNLHFLITLTLNLSQNQINSQGCQDLGYLQNLVLIISQNILGCQKN
ncbi:hypothetical protein ABPG72_021625 [Tetrahymena utriculariae]